MVPPSLITSVNLFSEKKQYPPSYLANRLSLFVSKFPEEICATKQRERFINNEQFEYARSCLMANAFNSSLRGDVGYSCIAGFHQYRLSGKYKTLYPLTSSTF